MPQVEKSHKVSEMTQQWQLHKQYLIKFASVSHLKLLSKRKSVLYLLSKVTQVCFNISSGSQLNLKKRESHL